MAMRFPVSGLSFDMIDPLQKRGFLWEGGAKVGARNEGGGLKEEDFYRG